MTSARLAPRFDIGLAPLLAVVFLLAGLGLQVALPTAPPQPAMAERPARRPAATLYSTSVSIAPVPDYPAILARPLFNPTRSDAIGPGEAKPDSLSDYTLVGISITGSSATAVVRRGGEPPKSLRIGQRLGGFRLTEIHPDRVAFEAGGETRVLSVGAAAIGAGPR